MFELNNDKQKFQLVLQDIIHMKYIAENSLSDNIKVQFIGENKARIRIYFEYNPTRLSYFVFEVETEDNLADSNMFEYENLKINMAKLMDYKIMGKS